MIKFSNQTNMHPIQRSLTNGSSDDYQLFKSNQCIRAKFEVDEEDVPVEGAHSKVVNVQVLHQLPQVGVEDVGEERVEHFEADFPAEFLSLPQILQNCQFIKRKLCRAEKK